MTNNSLRPTNGRSFADFAAKLSAKWRMRTQPTSHAAPGLQKDIEEILRDLVAIPTVSGNYEANHEALNYIEQFLRACGMHIVRHEWNGVESLVATTRLTKTPTIFFAGHIDVVPAPASLFQLKKQSGKYYGRGVLDMKGAVAAFLSMARELRDQLTDYDFGIMIMTDEEVGGFDGAAKLADEGYIAQVMVLPDGGANWDIERFAKGIWHLTVEATGKSAHGSRPWEGDNAIDKLHSVLQQIRALFPDTMQPDTSTINIGMINGGAAINQIPAKATASCDMRFASLEDQKRVTAAAYDLIKQAGLKVITELEAAPMVNDPAHPLLASYAACTKSIIGHTPTWVISNAANDGRFFASKGVQCAISYPEGANHHGPEEYITVKSLKQMQQLFVAYTQEVGTRTPRA